MPTPTRRRSPTGWLTFVALAAALTATTAVAGNAPDGDGGGPIAAPVDYVSDGERAEIRRAIDRNIANLEAHGLLPRGPVASPLFQWPLAAASGVTDYGLDAISNFVDQNAAFPDQLLDYNCGTRTYDLDSGYNHKGIDIYTTPFPWHKMDDSEVEVVAAAPGTISYKVDGNYDRNCGFGAGSWNAVYVEHADGSESWYGHMKNGSTTSKGVGKTVVAGEYLGVVGSSGNSTGPHLHFETYDSGDNLIEPFAGACNSLNVASWWATQPAYRDSGLNHLATNFGPPSFNACPEQAARNESD